MSEIKNDKKGNDWLPEINSPFPVVMKKNDLLPEYSFSDVTLNAPSNIWRKELD